VLPDYAPADAFLAMHIRADARVGPLKLSTILAREHQADVNHAELALGSDCFTQEALTDLLA
jgi:hypothetical protein